MADENEWKLSGAEEDEEEEFDEAAYRFAKDAVLFTIEVSPSMLAPPSASDSKKADKDTPASAALKCAYSLMQQRIISNPNDLMGVLLYGTKESKFAEDGNYCGGMSYPHCYVLIDLGVPAADDVKALKTLVEDRDGFEKLTIPSEEPVSMANVLFCANQIFTTRASNFVSRRLFIVTDNDNPHEKDKAMKSSAAVRAKDLYDLGVVIELFPISKPDGSFDRGKFYDDIIYNSSLLDPEATAPVTAKTKTAITGDGITLLHSLLSSINSKATAKRALFSNLPFKIGPGFTISVSGYIIFKRQEPQRSCYIWLSGEQAQIAKLVSTQTADDNARVVEKGEMKKAFKFGGAEIIFTPEELASLRHFGDPGLSVIGFKPMSMLPFWANLKPSTFIYPSEGDYVGSTRVFSALYQKLLNDQKIGIAWYVARKNAVPVIAAIVPGDEKLNDDGEQVVPSGMWIIPLPFADDIRQNPGSFNIRSPDPLTSAMWSIIQQLQLPGAQYSPQKYPNPSLQWHYRILQALALDEDIPEKPEDKTVPRYRQIDKRAGAYVMDWGLELESQFQKLDLASKSAPVPAKRPGASAKDGEPAKKVRVADPGATLTDEEMKTSFKKNSISKLTMAALRAWMHPKGLPLTGKKQDLVERVETYFEKK